MNNAMLDGLVTNLARPGGNITGISLSEDLTKIVGKRLQLLAEAVSKLSNVRYLTASSLDAKAKVYMEDVAENAIGQNLAHWVYRHRHERFYDDLFQRLRELGYTEGQNLIANSCAISHSNRQRRNAPRSKSKSVVLV